MNNEQNINAMTNETRKVATPAEAMELLNIENNYKNYCSFMDVVYERREGYTTAPQVGRTVTQCIAQQLKRLD